MVVAVIDSGLSSIHNFGANIIGGVWIKENNNKFEIDNTYEDEIGHGTAIVDILLDTAPGINVFCIKIFENQMYTSLERLCVALEYIYDNLICDLIQISAGVTVVENFSRLSNIINKLHEKNILIVSAFDNNGSISYPAALENVIGVDTTNECKKGEYEIVEDGIIDIRASNSYFRTKWINPKHVIIRGSSFTTAYITGVLVKTISQLKNYKSKHDLINHLKQSAKRIYSSSNSSKLFDDSSFVRGINKAIAFPFNKEIHPISIFPELLDFEIVGYYDTKYSKNINKRVDAVLKHCKNNNIIKNYTNIDWESDFDTLICGHCSELSRIMEFDIMEYFIELCLRYNKKMYTFDNIYKKIEGIEKKELFCFPYIDINDVPQNRFGKLRQSSKPIIGILGTSSQQGKYTLQLHLRCEFNRLGYTVGQLGTEPSGFLFRFNHVFPMGYNSNVFINSYSSVNVLNEMIWDIETTNPDVIIVGSQSGTVTYDTGNLSNYLLSQYDFLLGTLPDAVILCINPHDDINYIIRTINFIESATESKVIGLVLFPLKLMGDKTSVIMTRKKITDDETKEICENIENITGVKAFSNINSQTINELVQHIISYFM